MSNSPPPTPPPLINPPLDQININLHANTIHHANTPNIDQFILPFLCNHPTCPTTTTTTTNSSLHSSPCHDSSLSIDLLPSQSMSSSFASIPSSTLPFTPCLHTNRLPDQLHSIPDRLDDESLSILTLESVQPLDPCSKPDSKHSETMIVDTSYCGSSSDDSDGQCTDFTVVTTNKPPSIQSASTQTPSLDYMPSSDQVPLHLDPEVDMALTEELWDMYEKLRPSEQDLTKRRILVDRLQHIFDSEWPSFGFIVHPFGSAVNMLCTRHSDLDVCLTTADEYEQNNNYAPRSLSPVDDRAFHNRLSAEADRYTSKSRSISATNTEYGNHKHNGQYPKMYMRNPSEMMVEIAAILKKHGFRDIDLRKARARVPVIRFVDGDLNISCDININNPLALHNTLFVRHYVMHHPLVAPFMVLVKYWTQTRVLNDASAGSLSSYCWTILMIYFLQQCKIVPVHPFNVILPDLALWEATRSSPKYPGHGLRMPPVPPHRCLVIAGPPMVFRCPVSGDCPPDGEHTPRIRHSAGTSPMTPPTMTLGALYYAFFRFFCMEFTYDTTVVGLRGLETIDWDAVQTMVRDHAQVTQVAVDTGKMHKQLKLWAVTQLPPRDYRPLCVEDPLNPMRNLANNACLSAVMGIQKEMWRVVYILSTKPVYFNNNLKAGSRAIHGPSPSVEAGSTQTCIGTQTETFDADDWLMGELPDSNNLDEPEYDHQSTLYLRRLCEKIHTASSGHTKLDRHPVLANYPTAAPIAIAQPSPFSSSMVYSNMMPVVSPIFSMLPITRSVQTPACSSDSSDTTESSCDDDNDTLSNRFTSATDATDSSIGSSNLTLISLPHSLDPLSNSHQPPSLHKSAPSAEVNTLPATALWCYYMVPPIAHQDPSIALPPPPSIPLPQKSYLSKLANNNQFRHDSVHSIPIGSQLDTMNCPMSQYSQTRPSRPAVRQSHVKSYTDLSYLANNSATCADFEMTQARKMCRSIPRRDYLANSMTQKRSMNDKGGYFSGQNGYHGISLALDNNGLGQQHALAHQIQSVTRLVDVGLCSPVSNEQVSPVNTGSQLDAHDHAEEAPRAPAPLSRATSPTSAVSPTFAMSSIIPQIGNNARATDIVDDRGSVRPMYTKRYSWSAEAGDLIVPSHTGALTKPLRHAPVKSDELHPQIHGVRHTLDTSDLLQQEQNKLEVQMSKLHYISSTTFQTQAVDAYKDQPGSVKKNGVIRPSISPTQTSSSPHQLKPAKAAWIPNSGIRSESPTNILVDDHDFTTEEQVADSKSPLMQNGCSSGAATALSKTPMVNPQLDGRRPISWAQVVSSTSPLVGCHARRTVSNLVSPASTSPSKVHLPSAQLKSWQG